jgi:hypothetical protein
MNFSARRIALTALLVNTAAVARGAWFASDERPQNLPRSR